MTTRIAFIRGINVGGKTVVPMAALRDALGAAGLQRVRTYIQSGNVVYDAPEGANDSAALVREAAIIGGTVDDISGFTPAVMTLTADAVAAHLAASPYAGADPAKAFIAFVDGPADKIGDLDSVAAAGEQWQVIDGVVHLDCPDGVGRSKLWAKVASAPVPTTTRNLRTIAKVLELART